MNATADTVPDVPRCVKPRHDRRTAAATVISFAHAREKAISQRQFARDQGVARSTLQGWVARRGRIDAKPSVVAFLESPDGLEFAHAIVTSAQYHFTEAGPDGIRRLQAFIRCSPLAPFVASSYGSLQKSARIMEDSIIDFDAEQKPIMAKAMTPKKVSLAEDESFFPEPCLVAIDPVSNFIFLEEYADDRTAETWNTALKKSIDGLPVVIIQSVSDQAKGLMRHALVGLGVHHSPDLFHVQREVSKAFGPMLRALIRKAKGVIDAESESVAAEVSARDEYLRQITSRGPGRPPDFEGRIETAKTAVVQAQASLTELEKQQEEVYAEIRGIGIDHHPFDLQTGQMRQAPDVEQDLAQRFEALEAIADDLGMKEQPRKYVEKARRVIPELVATIAFFWSMVTSTIKERALPKAIEQFVRQTLIPLAYLKLVAPKLKSNSDQRDIVRATIARLQEAADSAQSPIACLDADIRTAVLALARECAEIFQRSSSSVEGRNGTLSLHHHAGRNLTPRRLRVLNIIHELRDQTIRRNHRSRATFRLQTPGPVHMGPRAPAATQPASALARRGELS